MPITTNKQLAPNPLMEGLKKAGSWATTPLIGEEAIRPAQDAIDHPSLDRSPNMARLQGFGAGALEGIRGFTTPIDVASGLMGAGGMLGALRGSGRAAKAISPTLDILEEAPIKQVAPAMDDVDALIGDLKRNLARVGAQRKPPMETLGEIAPEFTPVGGEGMYNTAKQGLGAGRDALQGLYEDLMKRGMGGRAR